MKQLDISTKRRGGKHFDMETRIRMETMLKCLYPRGKRPNFTVIANGLGRSRSSVSREYRRGLVVNMDSQLREYQVYSAEKAAQAAAKAALAKGPGGKLTNWIAAEIRRLILEERLSPYAVAMRMKKYPDLEWSPSERTIYNAIYAGLIGVGREHLPYKPKDRKRRRRGVRMAYNNSRGLPITQRPKEADERSEPGHWEIDTVVGGTGTSPACLVTLTERMTRRVIIRKIPDRTQRSVVRALNGLERRSDNIFATMKSLTSDNGGEFLDFRAIETSVFNPKRKRCAVYYAHPFSAFERGSNENANRIVRRFVPKGADISKFTRRQIQEIEDWINNLPRRLHDGLSASEKVELYFKENA